jgi:thiamine pyrophosphokinase
MRVFVVAGSPQAEPPAELAPAPDDRVIAADFGAHHARAWGWPVHLLIGDLDSLPAEDAATLAGAGVPIITALSAKDETDLELALLQALAEDPVQIVICAALGGRADHMLANVLLLARPNLRDRRAIIADGAETLQLLAGGETPTGTPRNLSLAGAPGDLLSLLPIGGDAGGVTTGGLLYPLHEETLYLGQPRGVSNVFTGTTALVSLRIGLLLVIHTRGN